MVKINPEGLGLPQSVLDRVQFVPTEDVILEVLRRKLPDVPSFSMIPADPPEIFILVRKDNPVPFHGQEWTQIAVTRFVIDVFTTGPNGDEAGALLCEAIRVVFQEAWLENMHIPGKGWVSNIAMYGEGTRVADWATSAGPVQYADLPTGYWRFEAMFRLKFRRQLD